MDPVSQLKRKHETSLDLCIICQQSSQQSLSYSDKGRQTIQSVSQERQMLKDVKFYEVL